MKEPLTCSVDGCTTPARSRGMCQPHYRKFMKYGTAVPTVEMKKKPGPKPNPTAPRSRHGSARANEGKGRTYDHLYIGGTCKRGHTLTAENTFTSPRSGYLRCGVCRTNATKRNGGRPEVSDLQVANGKKTHCKRGHEFTPENTKILGNGSRRCIACQQAALYASNYKKYGISYEDKVRLMEEQGGLCKICKDPFPDNPRKIHLDHFHEDGTIRGVLCGSCNYGIGCFRDSPERLMAAAQYLMESNAFRFDPDTTISSNKT